MNTREKNATLPLKLRVYCKPFCDHGDWIEDTPDKDLWDRTYVCCKSCGRFIGYKPKWSKHDSRTRKPEGPEGPSSPPEDVTRDLQWDDDAEKHAEDS